MATLTLRERQRLDILAMIHASALEVLETTSLSDATVEAIAERAGISRRTFFNYFATKEDAILGTNTPEVPDEAKAAFFSTDASPDQFSRTVYLISAVLATTRRDTGTTPVQLRALVERFPALRPRLQQHTHAAEQLVAEVLNEHFAQQGTDREEAAESARALLLLASAVTRFAYLKDPGGSASLDAAAIQATVDVFKAALAQSGTPGLNS